MSEVSDIVIKRTQDSLCKIIKKPALTEKLLRKPPFKFLHDIIHAVIKTTGFLGGLYSDDELQSDNIRDRDSKIAFLQKTIDVLKLATKQEVKARPSKIVAGLEADKTNELLVAIAKAIDRKIDTTDAVAKIKNGNLTTAAAVTQRKDPVKTAKNESRRAKPKEPSASKKVKSMAGADGKSSNKLSKQSSTDSKMPKTKSSSQHRDKEKEKDRKKEHEKTATLKTESVTKIAKSESVTEPTIEAHRINGNVNNLNQELKPNESKIESVDNTFGKETILPNVQHETQEKPEKREETPKTTPEKRVEENIEEKPLEKPTQKSETSLEGTNSGMSESIEPTVQQAAVKSTVEKSSAPEKVEKSSNDKPRSSKLKKSHSKHDTDKNSDNAKLSEGKFEKFTSSKSVDKLIERPLVPATTEANDTNKQSKPPRTALRSAAVRPISARPSAPRRRDRNVRQIIHTESFIQDTAEQKAEKKNAIPDFDDADNIVITETLPDSISTMDEPVTNNVDGDIDGTKQGHLVQQILETQTAILKSDAKNDISVITDDRKSITRNMTELRKMIQKLSLCITPLGKMMEYFQEDVDGMQIELLMWQKARAAAEADIKGEQRTTEKLLENFKYQLAEINNSIKDHTEQINNTTMNIIQNEEKISKLISTLN